MSRILIVEDQQNLQRSLRRGLEVHGYEVLVAGTGEEGLLIATTQEVDAIILDVMLPGRNGFDILYDLRNASFEKPVLILTARDSPGDRHRGKLCGADRYIAKPFGFAEILSSVDTLLHQARTTVESRKPTP